MLADTLRTRILDGTLAPGEPLRQEELSSHHDVSRHTLRTALATLTAERLVVAEPYRGARVADLDDAALVALQQLRCALETEAVRLLHDAHGAAWPAAVLADVDRALDALEAAEHAGDWPGTARAHAGVHRALVDAAGSPRISEVCAGLDAELLLLLRGVRPHYGPGALAAEHRAYVDALRSGRVEAVREHLARSTALILEGRRQGGPQQ
ncbi:GntR family transcriptional regulator [Nocardioides sp. CFH 31398]|uniref:GntR family transcriptional regulator n=1 Tax=Nocardioides sp. CFH 31398 TaxID=2919579 RepID=UPI001F0623AE|nr:GntR family transcriptional regulator [Nocardioides sp. CFH 31398]MCH1866821.1 GntR family transcriptional regulator [Nocardioides sp. CFH 31398]